MMDTKTFRAELKQVNASGTFEAVVATLGVVDHDGDIIEPGALAGKVAAIVPAHQQHTVPLGKVKIEERGSEVIAMGTLNLTIPAAKDWHEALKFDLANPPAVQEWSWGYVPIDAKDDIVNGETIRRLMNVDLMEVSPVLRGASIGTRTLGVKANGVKLAEQVSEACKVAEAALRRVREAHEQRKKEGRQLSEETRAEAILLAGKLAEIVLLTKGLSELVEELAPNDAVSRALAAWTAAEARRTLGS